MLPHAGAGAASIISGRVTVTAQAPTTVTVTATAGHAQELELELEPAMRQIETHLHSLVL